MTENVIPASQLVIFAIQLVNHAKYFRYPREGENLDARLRGHDEKAETELASIAHASLLKGP